MLCAYVMYIHMYIYIHIGIFHVPIGTITLQIDLLILNSIYLCKCVCEDTKLIVSTFNCYLS